MVQLNNKDAFVIMAWQQSTDIILIHSSTIPDHSNGVKMFHARLQFNLT